MFFKIVIPSKAVVGFKSMVYIAINLKSEYQMYNFPLSHEQQRLVPRLTFEKNDL